MENVTSDASRHVWVRPRRAARMLDMGVTKLYELIGDGRLVTRRVDGMRLVSVASIEKLGGQPDTPAAV